MREAFWTFVLVIAGAHMLLGMGLVAWLLAAAWEARKARKRAAQNWGMER